MKKINPAVRNLLVQLFKFHWRSKVSYDYIIKVTSALGSSMLPIHLMIQSQRLKLFARIIRMPADRDLRVLFGEMEGIRFRSRPNTQWIDNIIETGYENI